MMKYKKLFMMMVSFLLLVGCVDESHKNQPRGPWVTKAKRYSQFESFRFHSGSVSLSARHKKKIKQLVADATLDTPLYARLIVNAPATQSKRPLLRQRVEHLKKYLKWLGVKAHRIEVSYLSPSAALSQNRRDRNMVTVVVDQYEVIKPKCPGLTI